MKKNLIDFKTISNENLIKLWVAHYKKYAEDKDKKLLDMNEVQAIYDEGYKRGITKRLVQLFNAIYLTHITARGDLNNGVTTLYTLCNMYRDEYERLGDIADIYTKIQIKTEAEKAYREKVAEYLLEQQSYAQNDTDEYTAGERAIEDKVKFLKSSILLIKRTQEVVGMDIATDEAKEQIKSTRRIIIYMLGELSDQIGYLEYALGIMKNEEGVSTGKDEDFYNFVDKHIGVAKLAKRMAKLQEIIDRQLDSKGWRRALQDRENAREKGETVEKRTGMDLLTEVYPIENYGLPQGEIDELERGVEKWQKLDKMI